MNEQNQNEISVEEENIQQVLAQKPKRRFPLLAGTALVSAVLALVVSIESRQHIAKIELLQNQLQQNQAQLNLLEQSLKGFQTDLVEMKNQFFLVKNKLQDLEKNQEQASGLKGSVTFLQTVISKLELAYFILQFNLDRTDALLLLESASQQLSRIHEPRLLLLQQKIIQDEMALKSVNAVDKVSLLARLAALKENIIHLPLKRPQINQSTQASQKPVDTSRWRQVWQESVRLLESVIIIRHHPEPIKPLLSLQQHVLVLENIRLLLQQAQWAVIHQEDALYQAALGQVEQWINTYFEPNVQTTQTAKETVLNLKSMRLKPVYPDISATIMLANQLVNQGI